MNLKIGNISIKNPIVLAPMAGISNPAYMKICEEMGIGYAVSELISAEAIVRNNKKTLDMLKGFDELKIPVAVQIFGSKIETMIEAAKILETKYKIKIIDINMGCPVPKVAIKSQAGSALLKDPEKVFTMISEIVKSISIPVTVKIRSGWDNNSINAPLIAKLCEEAGASAITIHPRTRSQGYTGQADWSIIKKIKESVHIPVIGNGDIVDIYTAKKMLVETGCDMIMIGRGLIGNPWLIKEINTYLESNTILPRPSIDERIEMILKHLNYLTKLKSEKLACLEIRSHIGWYLKGLKNTREIKEKVCRMAKICDIINVLNQFKEGYNETI